MKILYLLPIDDEYMDWWYYNDAPVDEDFLAMAKYEASKAAMETLACHWQFVEEPQDLEDIPAMVICREDDYLMNETARDQFAEAYGDNVGISATKVWDTMFTGKILP